MKAEDWIKVSDALPKQNDEVLIHFWNTRIALGYIYDGTWIVNFGKFDIDMATHWMPIVLPNEDFV